jgi:hypothetical protein
MATNTQVGINVPANSRVFENEDQRFQKAVSATGVPQAYQGLHPLAYRSLQTGPNLQVEYEQNTTIPIDGSNAWLRKLSPFILQIEPPLVFGEDSSFFNPNRPAGIWSPNAMSAGSGMSNATNNYEATRANLAQSRLSNLNTNVGTLGSFIVQNSHAGPDRNKSSQNIPVDQSGSQLGRLGEPAIADMQVALDIAWQLMGGLNTPPLVLLINPQSLSIAYSKIQQFSDRSRYGYIFQAWGEEQVKLTISAKCGGFVSGQRGYQFSSKRDSAAWQNWMNMYHFYRNNGYIYDTVGKSFANHFVGALSIRYDSWIYYGHMESFSYSYDENLQMGGMDFNIDFVASSTVDLAQQIYNVSPMRSPVPSISDPRYSGMQARSQNMPGTYTLGVDRMGYARIGTQGKTLNTTPFSSAGTRINRALEPLPVTTGGFRAVTPQVTRQVEQASGQGLALFTKGR